MPITRKRTFATGRGGGTLYRKSVGSSEPLKLYKTASGVSYLAGSQSTTSEGHPFRHRDKRGPLKDIGGPFFTTKSYIASSGATKAQLRGFSESNLFEQEFRGGVWIKPPLDPIKGTVVFPKSVHSEDSSLNTLGATAVELASPTNQAAAASTFLGELLKERLPRIPGISTWESRANALVRAGDEFLNIVFGWAPMISDVKEIASSISQSDAVLDQYVRDSGKVVRRQYYFPTKRTSKETAHVKQSSANMSVGIGGFSEAFFTDPGALFTISEETEIKQWFSGAFTYHIPHDANRVAMLGSASEADKLLGTSLTPETLWELTPWSWAIDWFSNAQEVITNLDRLKRQGLVMRYGYMMEHSISKVTYILEKGGAQVRDKNGSITQLNLAIPPLTLVTETKKRVKANPFGFGLTWEGLDPLKLAIAAALGITRFG